ncbi:hypothetical protein JTE90_002076 [Oedothorax gibbosus]|uniref:Uncharacterized protein n=1 Tax=Oedothorax gibbosus TaxID=931172 RepID=A0AAV6UDU0_9ARAC|nr:hypothetical protein JTE90_002076 [Oedothorax gibbosus]
MFARHSLRGHKRILNPSHLMVPQRIKTPLQQVCSPPKKLRYFFPNDTSFQTRSNLVRNSSPKWPSHLGESRTLPVATISA